MSHSTSQSQPATFDLPSGPVRIITHSEWAWLAVSIVLILMVAISPYVYGVLTTPPTFHYSGIVWMTYDHSLLLSVMWEGIRGHWLHHPPYVTSSNIGALFYPQYVLLGHLAAWLGSDVPLMLHLGRIAGGITLLFSLYWFISRFFTDIGERRFAFLLAATGSGLGWVTFFLIGQPTAADLRYGEAFPFFSILSSLHLTWAMAALLWLVDWVVPMAGRQLSPYGWLRFIFGSILVGVTQPFGIVIAGAIGTLWLGTCFVRDRRIVFPVLACIIIMAALAAPFILYTMWTIATNPNYVGWREQVETISPPVWDYLVGIGLLLPFVIAGTGIAIRRRQTNDLLLLSWLGATAILAYLPYYQNRRFIFGAWVPIIILAVIAFRQMPPLRRLDRRLGFVALTTLSNLIILLSVMMTIDRRDENLTIPVDDWNAIVYLRDHAPDRAVVLASPTISLYVMASSSLRVLYGSPGETPHAAEMLAKVNGYFDGTLTEVKDFLAPVDYILIGPPERTHGKPPVPLGFAPVFESGGVEVLGREKH